MPDLAEPPRLNGKHSSTAPRKSAAGFSAPPGTPAYRYRVRGTFMRALLVNVPDTDAQSIMRALQREGSVAFSVLEPVPDRDGANEGRYDAILLGVSARVAPAIRLVRRWRRRHLHTGIVALMPQQHVSNTIRIIDAGADDCLASPSSAGELVARLRAVARRRRPEGSEVVRIGDLEIDPARRAVCRAGELIRLTRLQYRLLQLLVSHRGQIVSRQMIWEHLYDDLDEPGSNVIEVHMRNLRRKIDNGHTSSLIMTQWGEGYLIRDDD